MTIGQRIRNQRQNLELTVDEVAAELNKNRATIYRYESDEIENLPITVLEPLAEILHTTPAYLMGWTDDPYDYDRDEDNRMAQIPTAIFNHLQKIHDGDCGAIWAAYQAMNEGADFNPLKNEQVETTEPLNPDIRMIARAGKKMTDEQAETLRKYAQFMYPEAFKDDDK